MSTEQFLDRYRELQSYVGWGEDDVKRVVAAAPLLEPYLQALIDDFYDEIERHPDARKVITGGQAQIDRLKGTLLRWVRELTGGVYDSAYVDRRWRVGWRHVEIGLDQVYTNVALSRLRTGLSRALHESWTGDAMILRETIRSLDKLLDLDLAIIEDAYQSEYVGRLKRNERLATLGQVAGGVAHELRNPLNVVRTSVYYLLNARNANEAKKTEHLERIERHVARADGVITALSNFAKMPVPDFRPVALVPLLRETLELESIGENIKLQLNLPEGLPPVLADGDQLRIVFGNLIRNACDAMPDGGELTLEARAGEDNIEVVVGDTGMGISAENLSRIMEPLYSTKARGLGLGLSIARSILEKNNGSLKVTSEAGRGSIFSVRLLTKLEDQ